MSSRDELKRKIHNLLKELEESANKIRTNLTFCEAVKDVLKECGYNWFDNADVDISEYKNKEQVMRVFAAAVNKAIQKKVDLRNKNTEAVDKELCQLLGTKSESLRPNFFKRNTLQNIKHAKSPLDLAVHLLRSVPQSFVKSLIEHQFEMRWNTQTQTTRSPNGEPDDYTFYQFCEQTETTKFLKYIPRQAHVTATLYKECRKKNLVSLRAIKKEQLCPKVYIRVADGWKSCQTDDEQQQHTFNDVTNIESDLSWIDPSIRKFITKNADEQKVESLKDSLAKPTLYWAVLDDADFKSGGNLNLEPIGRTQVYVGKANNGIHGRWIEDSNNHCAMMKKCLDNVCGMTTYDPLRLEGIQLVDARLALAKVKRKKTALFVIKTFGDEFDKAEIALQKTEGSLRKVIKHLRNNDFGELQTLQGAAESLCEAQNFCYKYLTKAEKSFSKAQESPCEDLRKAQKSCCIYLKKAGEYLGQSEKLYRKTLIKPEKHLHQVKESCSESLINLCQARKVFRAARATLEILNSHLEKKVKKRQDKLDKAAAIEELEEAEKRHRDGDRVDGTKIIHENDIEWLPKDMRYGMNFN